ncbi:MAG: hypothetical protein EOM55_01265 [Clostridia bacterium]|nr:hypothetical protein [Clostridia bacterium]
MEIEKNFDKNLKNKNIILTSLFDLAKGCILKEKTEDFVTDLEGNISLKNRKIVRKQLAPDLQAIKVLMDLKIHEDFEEMTDEQLQKEKERLLEEIKNC